MLASKSRRGVEGVSDYDKGKEEVHGQYGNQTQYRGEEDSGQSGDTAESDFQVKRDSSSIYSFRISNIVSTSHAAETN